MRIPYDLVAGSAHRTDDAMGSAARCGTGSRLRILERKLGDPVHVDPFSALYFLVNHRHPDDQCCHDHGHPVVPARPRSGSLSARILRTHDGDGTRDGAGGELVERFVDDVWGNFVGYDGLRDI